MSPLLPGVNRCILSAARTALLELSEVTNDLLTVNSNALSQSSTRELLRDLSDQLRSPVWTPAFPLLSFSPAGSFPHSGCALPLLYSWPSSRLTCSLWVTSTASKPRNESHWNNFSWRRQALPLKCFPLITHTCVSLSCLKPTDDYDNRKLPPSTKNPPSYGSHPFFPLDLAKCHDRVPTSKPLLTPYSALRSLLPASHLSIPGPFV